jgi:hypothetical protein
LNRDIDAADIPKVMEGLALAIDVSDKIAATWGDIKARAR